MRRQNKFTNLSLGKNACERVNLTFLMICVKVARHFSTNHTFSMNYQTNFYTICSLH